MKKTMSACAALLVAMVMGACSGQTAPNEVATEVEVVQSAPQEEPDPQSASAPAPETEAPAPPSPQALTLGSTEDLESVSVTVYEFQADIDTDGVLPTSDADKYVAVDAQICSHLAEEVEISSSPWNITDTENRSFTQDTYASTFPVPTYAPPVTFLQPGECNRGWIVFTVNKASTLETIKYRNADGETAIWSIP